MRRPNSAPHLGTRDPWPKRCPRLINELRCNVPQPITWPVTAPPYQYKDLILMRDLNETGRSRGNTKSLAEIATSEAVADEAFDLPDRKQQAHPTGLSQSKKRRDWFQSKDPTEVLRNTRFNFAFEAGLLKQPQAARLELLKKSFQTGIISADTYQVLEREYVTGDCDFRLDDDGKLLRIVQLQVLELRHEQSVLLRVANWKVSKGFVSKVELPGGKLPRNNFCNTWMHAFIDDNLGFLPYSHRVVMHGHYVEVQTTFSKRFQVQTRYRKVIVEATLTPKVAENSGHRRRSKPSTLGRVLAVQIQSPSKRSWPQLCEIPLLADVAAFLVRNNDFEADIFTWMPLDLYETMDEMKLQFHTWASSFKVEAEDIMAS